jgi:predicted nucleotidyltransferase
VNELRQVCEEHDIELVILFGSHAKGTARPDSDYDLGILKRSGSIESEEMFYLAHDLGQALNAVNVDLVDLRHAPPVLKFDAARLGQVLFEGEPGRFDRFHVLAWKLYLDDHYDLRRLDREYVQNAVRESFGEYLVDTG